MLDENPFLERDSETAEREEFGLSGSDTPVSEGERETEFAAALGDYPSGTTLASGSDDEVTPLSAADGPDWDGDGSSTLAPDDGEWGGEAQARGNNLEADEQQDATELARAQESLPAFLHRQALALRLAAPETAALRFLIESLNDDGYLEEPLTELMEGLLGGSDGEAEREQLLHYFTVALGLLQSLEPTGVGARNLAECLQLQIRSQLRRPEGAGGQHLQVAAEVLALALRICEQPMELLARRDVRRLAHLCGGTDAQTREAIAWIARLEPKPGRRFIDVLRNIVVPDVLVIPIGKLANSVQPRFRVQLNPDVLPRLRVHDIYANVLRNHRGNGRDGGGHAVLQQRLQEARWFIKNIQQRFDTILRVSTAIVERQKSFFTHGELAMRPLVLREIADELGLHESTISRVTTAKYMATPYGTFELKYFFGSGLGTDSGGNASSTAVRALIRQFINAESSKKPLSDNQISEMLKEQGIDCARRTVAKYREGLKIAPASLRKAL
jgi:RNA polymerase sigma-54 factor